MLRINKHNALRNQGHSNKPTVAGKMTASLVATSMLIGTLLVPQVALAGAGHANAQVIGVDPIYETVSVRVPRQACHEEEVAYQEPVRRRSVTAPIIGAIIGGALGNAVGHHKRNRQVGTAVGAVLGGSIGADIGRNGRHQDGTTRYRTERVCRSIADIHEEERVAGYNVTYQYAGETYTTRMDRDPGDTLRVRVHVSPAS